MPTNLASQILDVMTRLDKAVEKLEKLSQCEKPHLVRYSFDPRTHLSEFVIQHEAFYDVIKVDTASVVRYHGKLVDHET